MSDHRIIRATLRGTVPDVVWYRVPKKTKWDDFRASIRRRIDGFKGKYGTPNELERTEAFIKTVITTAFQENYPITQKTTTRGKLKWSNELEARRKEQVGSLIERGRRTRQRLGKPTRLVKDSTRTSLRR